MSDEQWRILQMQQLERDRREFEQKMEDARKAREAKLEEISTTFNAKRDKMNWMLAGLVVLGIALILAKLAYPAGVPWLTEHAPWGSSTERAVPVTEAGNA